MNAHEILKAAAGHMSDRAATYDRLQGERSMRATVEAFRAVSGISLTEEQGWLFMALLKAVRSQQGAYRADSYEDGAAYFALAGESAALTRATPHDQTVPSPRTADSEPASEIDDTRPDIVASSHGDGEHYAELEKLERWKGAPEWATHLLWINGDRQFAGFHGDEYLGGPSDLDLIFIMDGPNRNGWKIMESRPCAN
jgi:hypothetical protein